MDWFYVTCEGVPLCSAQVRKSVFPLTESFNGKSSYVCISPAGANPFSFYIQTGKQAEDPFTQSTSTSHRI